MEFASPAGVPWRGKSAEAPSAGWQPRASGPYGHNTLTGPYFTPYSFNQSTGHILCPSMHGFVFLFQKFVFIKMHLQLLSAALLLLYFYLAPNTEWLRMEEHSYFIWACLLAVLSLHSRDHEWVFKSNCTFWDKTLIRAAQYWTKERPRWDCNDSFWMG